MTIPAYAEELGQRLPSADEKAVAAQLRKVLAAHMEHGGRRLRVLRRGCKGPRRTGADPSDFKAPHRGAPAYQHRRCGHARSRQ